MSQPIFRDEVLLAKRAGWLGGISLIQPVRFWLLTSVAVAAATSIVLFVCLGTYTRRSTVTGQLVPTQGLVTVLSPATGVVSWLDVPEGERVRAGGSLAMVSVPRTTADGRDTQVALEHRLQERQDGLLAAKRAQDEQLKAQSSGLNVQLAAVRRELAQIQSEVGTRQQQILIANETLQRLRKLEDDQFVSILQIKQQETALLEYRSQSQALQRQVTSTQRLIAQLQQARLELPSQRHASLASYQREIAQLEQERIQTKAGSALVVKAPVGGVVSSQMVKVGQAVQAGQPLMSLLPGDGRLEAELLVPSRAFGFIAPGDKVLLRYQTFPYQKFGHQQGRILRISRNAVGSGESRASNVGAEGSEPVYMVTVELVRQSVMAYGKPEQLRPGMLLSADLLGERRRLLEWALAPLYSIGGVIGE